MKKILSFVAIFCWSIICISQSVSPSAIVSAGNAATVGGVYVSWSVGETFTTTLSGGNIILTQGFQQPSDVISGCTNNTACNYDPQATQDDGSCILPVTPAVTITSSDADNTFCSGDAITFTATSVDGGASPTYQWQLNGANVGTAGSTFTSATLSNGDVVSVTMTANNACQTVASVTSNTIVNIVNPILTPSVTIASSDADNNICSGTSVTFTATPIYGGTAPTYQWKRNGSNVGTSSTTYTSSTLSNNDVVTVVMTANNTCQTSATANGNSISTTVSNGVTPSVTIASNDADNTICSGEAITFTATSVDGGSSPTYQWQINGINVGTAGSTFTSATLVNGDMVSVTMTANNTCQTSATANGNSITMTVSNGVTPSVTIASSDADNNICSGTSVTFTATPANGGTTPSYQWKLNGSNVGTNATTYINSALANNDVVTVVMTANNTCQTSATANGNSITTTVSNSVLWYLDADADGYYVSSQSACVSPGVGYTSNAGIQGDCNDNDANINAGSTDICGNGVDEDCSGSDCLIVLGCTDSTACNYDATANLDNGSCILPQLELCNGIDDNCNGQVDEGLTLGSVVATPVTTSIYPVCSGESLKTANLNSGTNSAIIAGDGPDLWYSINAQYNTLRASLSAAFGDNEIRLYRYTDGCFDLLETEHEVYTPSTAATGNQILISDNLVVGETYYVAVHRNSGISNNSAKICFNHFVGTTCDHYYSNYTGVYANVCTSFKAQYKGNATNYIFNILSATQNNTDLNITPWSFTTTTANSVVPRLGTIFPINMTASAKVYTLNIPVIYAIPDAAGNYTSITANATSTCTVTLNPELPVALRASDRCPNTKLTSSSISIDRTVCGALRYEWEFTQQIPSVQPAVTVLGGLNTTVFFLNNVPGMGTGKTYNVRVRPIHASGDVGNWGTAYCLKTGTSGMTMEDPSDMTKLDAQSEGLMIFPNPVSGQSFTLVSSLFEDENLDLTVMDVAGKLVMKRKVTFNGQQVQLDCGMLSDGVYMVVVGNQRTRLVVSK